MGRWVVTRVWEVDAEDSGDAMAAARPGEHYEVRAVLVSDQGDTVSAVVHTSRPQDWVLTDELNGSEWVIVGGKWKRRNREDDGDFPSPSDRDHWKAKHEGQES